MNSNVVNSLKRKHTKAEVHYVDKSSKSSDCDDCKHFIPPHACEGVAGFIEPEGWCIRFAAK